MEKKLVALSPELRGGRYRLDPIPGFFPTDTNPEYHFARTGLNLAPLAFRIYGMTNHYNPDRWPRQMQWLSGSGDPMTDMNSLEEFDDEEDPEEIEPELDRWQETSDLQMWAETDGIFHDEMYDTIADVYAGDLADEMRSYCHFHEVVCRLDR